MHMFSNALPTPVYIDLFPHLCKRKRGHTLSMVTRKERCKH
jgi:hypothetical protein